MLRFEELKSYFSEKKNLQKIDLQIWFFRNDCLHLGHCILFSIQAQQQGLSTGIKRVSGKGDRLLVIGCGGASGWIDWKVWKRSKANKNLPHNPKDDMGKHKSINQYLLCKVENTDLLLLQQNVEFQNLLLI